ncbi:D-glycero-alpha-D-manno-heptose-1,7-bisphosphate 7-phosphatase [Deinococcus pimensis]|uniref:D-glycero-alpha-D-manno-heptose-1,7-bisphosphate 7-phosphatase n=1 Tax=Deinococcus pimensis TaxID=309888 RepID=UPI0004B4BB72|nr:HAD family hydrolase [Deinococcus pimensis]
MAVRTGRRAVFLDKDGTLVVDVPYNVDPARVTLAPGAREGARRLHEAGYALVVVTNQSGVARGLFEEDALRAVEERLTELLGVPLAGFYFCPHHPEGLVGRYRVECECRKPRPGLIERAARELNLDLARSWMIGDILHDVEAGNRAGCRSVLVLTGGETEWLPGPHRAPTFTATDVGHAAELVLASEPVPT